MKQQKKFRAYAHLASRSQQEFNISEKITKFVVFFKFFLKTVNTSFEALEFTYFSLRRFVKIFPQSGLQGASNDFCSFSAKEKLLQDEAGHTHTHRNSTWNKI